MSFKDLHLIEPIQRALVKEGYTTPTQIQMQAIPVLLKGQDIVGVAQTGTGKTAAFVLPILQRMSEAHRIGPRTLVLVPTRELAAQVGASFSAYGRYLKFTHTVIYGGVNQASQVKALSLDPDIIIATPGRLLDLMNQRHVRLNHVEFLVLDEADRMLDMGFINDIRRIISAVPEKRQSLFFSATMSGQVGELARKMLHNPVRIETASHSKPIERIDQKVLFVDQDKKDELLLDLLKSEHLKCVLIFTRTKHRANRIAIMLAKNRIRVDAIHGNKTQGQRMRALEDFKTGRVKVLVATDIAARGIDIDNISHVINYELPNDPDNYVHRIGRTARAGTEGTAYSFCAADERSFLREIERLTKMEIPVMTHAFHSEKAERATGAASRPPPRHQQSHPKAQGYSARRGPGSSGPRRDKPRRYR